MPLYISWQSVCINFCASYGPIKHTKCVIIGLTWSEKTAVMTTPKRPAAHIWPTRCCQIYPAPTHPRRMAISQIPTVRAHIGRQSLLQRRCSTRKTFYCILYHFCPCICLCFVYKFSIKSFPCGKLDSLGFVSCLPLYLLICQIWSVLCVVYV